MEYENTKLTITVGKTFCDPVFRLDNYGTALENKTMVIFLKEKLKHKLSLLPADAWHRIRLYYQVCSNTSVDIDKVADDLWNNTDIDETIYYHNVMIDIFRKNDDSYGLTAEFDLDIETDENLPKLDIHEISFLSAIHRAYGLICQISRIPETDC